MQFNSFIVILSKLENEFEDNVKKKYLKIQNIEKQLVLLREKNFIAIMN